MKQILILPLLTLLINTSSLAQDKMVFTHFQDTFIVKIFEIGEDEITYKTWPPLDSNRFFSVKKKDLRFIILSNGFQMNYNLEKVKPYKVIDYTGQRMSAVKFDVLSILKNRNYFSYERCLKRGFNIEAGIGFIGLTGRNPILEYIAPIIYNHGVLLSLGVKFNHQLNFPKKHILAGFYLKPELILISHTQEIQSYHIGGGKLEYNNHRYQGAALVLNGGKQFVFYNRICLDINIGLGFGKKTMKLISTGNPPASKGFYTDTDIGFIETDIFPYTVSSAGFKLGYLLGPRVSMNNRKSTKQ